MLLYKQSDIPSKCKHSPVYFLIIVQYYTPAELAILLKLKIILSAKVRNHWYDCKYG